VTLTLSTAVIHYQLSVTSDQLSVVILVQYKNRLESGKQVVWPISEQTLVDWRLDECGNKVIGVCSEKLLMWEG
jgi:hypothetical protein